ncbi:MAG: RNA 2',3'-cyclic phosphodiesterase [Luteimonas sp.]
MHRLFFAMTPDDGLRRDIASLAQEQTLHLGGRAVRTERYHMTLQFVGDFDALTPALHDSLLAAADSVAAPMPMELVLEQLGSFHAGRVIWLGCSKPHEALTRLNADLAAAVSRAGIAIKAEDGFIPHVTVYRNGRVPMDRPVAPLRWRVTDFVLIDATAGEYRRLGRWPVTPGSITREC